MNNKIFLETSVQIKKIFGKERESILNFIEDKKTITSTYVLMEFNRRILKDCIYLYSILTEEETLDDVFGRLAELKRYEYRRAIICYSILSKLSEGGKLEKEEASINLKMLMDYQLKRQFDYGIKSVVDETKCELANEKIKEENNNYLLNTSCRRGKMKCEIEKFVEGNKKEVEYIMKGLKLNEEFKNVCNSLREVLNDSKKAMGKNCNRILGDCIISVETPKDYKILTTDHHYEIICKCIDKDTLLLQKLNL